ncbi:MAG: hypothetical protein GXO80_10265 [Chlorobi bacterium]|nr:hypothetical protein [Chlorobiota bacterium]
MGFFDIFSDTYTDNNGYKRYKKSNKLEHRKVVEKKLGRKLKKGEVVHHKDRNKKNNSADNLWVFRNQEEHDRTHKTDAKKYGKKYSYKGSQKKKKNGFWDDIF